MHNVGARRYKSYEKKLRLRNLRARTHMGDICFNEMIILRKLLVSINGAPWVLFAQIYKPH